MTEYFTSTALSFLSRALRQRNLITAPPTVNHMIFSTLHLHKTSFHSKSNLWREFQTDPVHPSDGELEVLARLGDAAAAVGAHDEGAVAVAAHPPANSNVLIKIVKIYRNN